MSEMSEIELKTTQLITEQFAIYIERKYTSKSQYRLPNPSPFILSRLSSKGSRYRLCERPCESCDFTRSNSLICLKSENMVRKSGKNRETYINMA